MNYIDLLLSLCLFICFAGWFCWFLCFSCLFGHLFSLLYRSSFYSPLLLLAHYTQLFYSKSTYFHKRKESLRDYFVQRVACMQRQLAQNISLTIFGATWVQLVVMELFMPLMAIKQLP